MGERPVVSALTEKRARVAGELKSAQLRVILLKNDLAHIDACLGMFKADYDPKTVEPKTTFGKNPAGVPKGAGSRGAMDILRETGEALSAQELARRILQRLGKPTEAKALDMLAKTIHSSFTRQKNPVARFDRSTYPGKWSLIR